MEMDSVVEVVAASSQRPLAPQLLSRVLCKLTVAAVLALLCSEPLHPPSQHEADECSSLSEVDPPRSGVILERLWSARCSSRVDGERFRVSWPESLQEGVGRLRELSRPSKSLSCRWSRDQIRIRVHRRPGEVGPGDELLLNEGAGAKRVDYLYFFWVCYLGYLTASQKEKRRRQGKKLSQASKELAKRSTAAGSGRNSVAGPISIPSQGEARLSLEAERGRADWDSLQLVPSAPPSRQRLSTADLACPSRRRLPRSPGARFAARASRSNWEEERRSPRARSAPSSRADRSSCARGSLQAGSAPSSSGAIWSSREETCPSR